MKRFTFADKSPILKGDSEQLLTFQKNVFSRINIYYNDSIRIVDIPRYQIFFFAILKLKFFTCF